MSPELAPVSKKVYRWYNKGQQYIVLAESMENAKDLICKHLKVKIFPPKIHVELVGDN